MDPFADLLRRTRDGDPDAFAELFAQFAPAVRQAVHVQGVPKHVRPVADTDDICQSVFIRLFAKLASGDGDFATPDDLRRYLSTMAKHRMIDHHRKRHDATGRPREAPLAPGADAPA